MTGLLHTPDGAPTEDTQTVEDWANYVERKLSDHLDEILDYDTVEVDDADSVVIAYGCTARAAEHAVHLARTRGAKVGFVKLRTIWPFADDLVADLADRVDRIIVPELNLGQIGAEVSRAAAGRAEVVGINRVNGNQITPDEIIQAIHG